MKDNKEINKNKN